MGPTTIWQIVLGIFLILLACVYLGLAIPTLILGIFALLAGIMVLVGK